jgi:outer membrane receptor protein involved in Fe transport
MNRTYARSGKCLIAYSVLAAMLAASMSSPQLLAQTAPAPAPAPATTPTPPPAPATTPASAADEEIIELSPFTITADQSNSYTALNTTSVTRFRSELAKLPVSADVFTETFIDDVAATSIDQLIVDYGTGTGIGGNDAAGEADRSRAGDRGGNITVKIRGLDAGGTRINSFGEGSINDAFNTERVDLIRGPQSLLNGGVGAGGVVNVTTKQARFNSDVRRLRYRIDDNGSQRAELDYGYGSRNIAIRTALMSESLRYSRVGLMRRAQGAYTQMAFAVTPNLTLRLEATHLFRKNSDARRDPELGEPSVTANATLGVVAANSGPNDNTDLRVLIADGRINTIYGGALSWLNWDNVDSLYTGYLGNETNAARYEGTLEYKTGTWGAIQLAAVYDRSVAENSTIGSVTDLNAPNRQTEGTGTARRYILPGEFVIGFRPESNTDFWARQGMRANMALDFELFNGKAKNQVLIGAQYETTHNKRIGQRYFEVDPATGNLITSGGAPEDLFRVLIPVQYFAVRGEAPVVLPFGRLANQIQTADGKIYRRADFGFPGGQERTPVNPLGWAGNGQIGPSGTTQGGTGGFWDQYSYNDSYYIAASTEWFDGMFGTLAGFRTGSVENKRFQQNHPGGRPRRSTSDTNSINLGVNYRLTNTIRPYYGYSNAYLPPGILQFGPDGEIALSSESEGHEFGIKFDPKDSIYSGSLAYFMTDSENEQGRTSLRGYINPGSTPTSSLNGEATPTDNWINLGRKSEGVELRLVANPTKNWRSVLSAAMTDGTVTQTKKYPVRYNDQFHTKPDGSGIVQRVSIDDPNLRSDMDTGTTFGAPVPLTIALMRQPQVLNTSTGLMVTNPFYYSPDPANPGFINAAGRNLLTRYYNSTGGQESTTANTTSRYRAATGINGLPFSDNQFGLPGNREILVAQNGDDTSGYAKYSATFTNNYDFTSGFLNGFSVGGTVFYKSENRQYIYTVFDNAGNQTRQMFFTPDSLLFDLVLKYTKRLGKRYTWTSQINIANVFDDYDVEFLPNEINGRLERARYTNEPRTWVWTNTFSF